jgi:large conductance mechanosensitive channel
VRGFRASLLRADWLTIACGVAVAIAVFLLVEAAVSYWIAPLIAIFIGNSDFGNNAFTIRSAEFRYGDFIELVLTLLLTLVLVWTVRRAALGEGRQQPSGAAALRACPECESSIPASAKRCRYCTAAVSPVAR